MVGRQSKKEFQDLTAAIYGSESVTPPDKSVGLPWLVNLLCAEELQIT